jgi:hypothetical protein
MGSIRSTYEDDPDMLEIVREFAVELPARTPSWRPTSRRTS